MANVRHKTQHQVIKAAFARGHYSSNSNKIKIEGKSISHIVGIGVLRDSVPCTSPKWYGNFK